MKPLVLIASCVLLFAGVRSFCQPIGFLDTTTYYSPSSLRHIILSAPTCNRSAIINDYINNIDRTAVTTAELNWTGNVTGCIPGTISSIALEKSLTRINYFRRLAGVKDSIVFRADLNLKCQESTLMMRANNTLNHTPPDTFKCYTASGAEAAGKSNLSFGSHSSAAINQYMEDLGSNNTAVGHRRWILYHRAKEFGFGSTSSGTALWVIGPVQTPKVIPEFIAYPAPGYFPKSLIYPRWSFSVPGANFTKTKATMKDEKGNLIPLTIEPMTQGFGDNTIVWVPSIGSLATNEDKLLKVKIDSVLVGSVYKSYEYSVLGINPVHQSIQKTVVIPCCGLNNGTVKIKYPPGYKSILWSTGVQNQDSISNLGPGTYYVTLTDKLDCELKDTIVIQGVLTSYINRALPRVKVSPNPAIDRIQIEVEDIAISSFELCDYLGRTRLYKPLTPISGSSHHLQVGHLPSGIYFLKIVGEKYKRTIIVVKK